MNNKYEVLTPDGWSDFSGIRVNSVPEYMHLETNKGVILKSSLNHPVLTVDGFKDVQDIEVGCTLSTKNGFEVVTKLEVINKPLVVYDLLDVKKAASYFTNDIVSHNCVEFLGSSGTLISGAKLKELFVDIQAAIHYSAGYEYSVYSEPQAGRRYCIIADVSRGKGLDYSAFQVIDITEAPYEQVATFRNNMITPPDYASFIFNTAKGYNNAYVMVEINDIGGQVSDMLVYDFGYEYVIHTESAGSKGKRVSMGYGSSIDTGVRTTTTVKALGCSMLKLLIEQNKLLIYDKETVNELAVFSRKGQSYEAETGYNDDTVMCLVLFAWLTTDDFFTQLNEENIMHSLRDLSDDQVMQTLTPFGVIHDPYDEDVEVIRMDGDLWEAVPTNVSSMGGGWGGSSW